MIREQNETLLNLVEVFKRLVRDQTDNCDIECKAGDFEIVFNISIVKIVKNGKVLCDVRKEEE